MSDLREAGPDGPIEDFDEMLPDGFIGSMFPPGFRGSPEDIMYCSGMALMTDLLVQINEETRNMELRIPSLIKKINVSLCVYNECCESAAQADPAKDFTTAMKWAKASIFRITNESLKKAMMLTLNDDYKSAIKIYRELGVCYVKCKHLPMVALVYENIAKCFLMAKNYEYAVNSAAQAIALSRSCVDGDYDKELILKRGGVILMTSIMGDCCVSETSKVYDLKAALELFTSALRMYELFTANGAMREEDFNLVSTSLRNSFQHNELPITVLRLKQLAENRSGSFDELNQFCVEQVVDTGASNMCISHSLQVCEDRFNLYVDVDEEWKWCLVHKIALVHFKSNNYSDAKRLFQDARKGFLAVGSEKKANDILMSLGEVHFRMKEYEAASEIFTELKDKCTDEEGMMTSDGSCDGVTWALLIFGKLGFCLFEQRKYVEALHYFFGFSSVKEKMQGEHQWVKTEGFGVNVKTAFACLELGQLKGALEFLENCKIFLAKEHLRGFDLQEVDRRESWGGEGLVALYMVSEAWFKCLKAEELQYAWKLLEDATKYRISEFVLVKWTEVKQLTAMKMRDLQEMADIHAKLLLNELEEEEEKKERAAAKKKSKRARRKAIERKKGGESVLSIPVAEKGAVDFSEAGVDDTREEHNGLKKGGEQLEEGGEQLEEGGEQLEGEDDDRKMGILLMEKRFGLGSIESGRDTGPGSVPVPSGEIASECCVCMTEEKNWIFIPCGHVCVCNACAKDIMGSTRECPLCCAKASGILQVFL
jgi:tetratricopeptide (TPR) repeat protein